jgi:hypothetical protein
MDATPRKISSIFKLFLALLICGILSLGIYLAAVPFIYAVWHCPPPRECSAPAWMQYLVFFILLAPLLIFAGGAYLCRNVVGSISQSKLLRALILVLFALFPLFALAALIAVIISDAEK